MLAKSFISGSKRDTGVNRSSKGCQVHLPHLFSDWVPVKTWLPSVFAPLILWFGTNQNLDPDGFAPLNMLLSTSQGMAAKWTCCAYSVIGYQFQHCCCNDLPQRFYDQPSQINDTTMVARHVMASQTDGKFTVCSTVCLGYYQRKRESPRYWLCARGIHRWPVDSPHKGPVTCINDMKSSRHSILTYGLPIDVIQEADLSGIRRQTIRTCE